MGSKANISVIMQARTGSTRLPGKVLKEVCNIPILIHDISRIKGMLSINNIVIATTDLPEDNPIVDMVQAYDNSIGICRGSSQNVLDRYYKAALAYQSDVIVRITSDCPLIDPEVSDLVVTTFLDNDCDYCCNNNPRSYPHGLDTEVFSFSALEQAWIEAQTTYEKEHVTPYIRESGKFKLLNVKNNEDLSNNRWTLDYPEDLEFIKQVYDKLYYGNRLFGMKDVLSLIEKEPWLKEINQKHAVF
jgi:spore coat polysaccharide biosynthesis protein SpsF (cytidylyltransferase family)